MIEEVEKRDDISTNPETMKGRAEGGGPVSSRGENKWISNIKPILVEEQAAEK